MTIQCVAPDGDLGFAIRLSGIVECQSRALGENGFQALIGGPLMASLLGSLLAIFVALIGYQLILGGAPSFRNGVGWAVRLGIVLALVTGWPAFQTLVFDIATKGPAELAAIVLPASGLPSEGVEERVQDAYDVMRTGRLGSGEFAVGQETPDQQSAPQPGVSVPSSGAASAVALAPLPQTASLLVVSTIGFVAGMRLVVGFLIALGPLGILGLLFEGTEGLFEGWLRALAGAVLGVLAATVTSAVEMAIIAAEISRIQSALIGGAVSGPVDTQALTTIVLLFLVIAGVMVFAGIRMGSALRLPRRRLAPQHVVAASRVALSPAMSTRDRPNTVSSPVSASRSGGSISRAEAIAQGLSVAAHREQIARGSGAGGTARQTALSTENSGSSGTLHQREFGARRTRGRHTRSAQKRDSMS